MRPGGRTLAWAAICIAAQILGCQPAEDISTAEQKAAKKPPQEAPTITLRVGVVNAPGVVSALRRLRGEWAESSGGELVVLDFPLPTVAESTNVENTVDLLIFPTRNLGQLCGQNQLRSVRNRVWQGDQYNANDLLPGVREPLAYYGKKPMALPLSVGLPLMCYRHDLVEESPATWSEYDQKAEQLATGATPSAITSPQNAAIELFLRAVPAAWNPQRDGVLFEPSALRPRIAEPPFVHALEQMVVNQKVGTAASDAPCSAIYSGVASLAFGFLPTDVEQATQTANNIRWAECPATSRSYNATLQKWHNNEKEIRLGLVGWEGYSIGVTKSSRNAASAFRLLAWMASSEISGQLIPETGQLPVRASHLARPSQFLARQISPEAARDIGAAAKQAFSRSCFVIPRIPGIEEYWDALITAIEKALSSETTPQEALESTSKQWEEITDRLGREQQAQAYLRHLNLAE